MCQGRRRQIGARWIKVCLYVSVCACMRAFTGLSSNRFNVCARLICARVIIHGFSLGVHAASTCVVGLYAFDTRSPLRSLRGGMVAVLILGPGLCCDIFSNRVQVSGSN